MLYSEVVTFFHEFGHLMHHILGSQGEWSAAGGFNVEGDFVEAPSQMLEEMFRNRTIISSFAKHYQTGETIPADLFEKMNAAGAYGRGSWVQRQLMFSTFSLQVHDRAPDKVDLNALWKESMTRFNPFTFVDGNRCRQKTPSLLNCKAGAPLSSLPPPRLPRREETHLQSQIRSDPKSLFEN